MTDQSIPPTVPDRDLSAVLSLVELLANPTATKERIEALRKHQATLEELVETLNEARDQHAREKTSFTAAENAAKARITAEQTKHVEACAERERALNVRETALGRVEAQTKADCEAASTLKTTLERRLAAVHAAARDVAA